VRYQIFYITLHYITSHQFETYDMATLKRYNICAKNL